MKTLTQKDLTEKYLSYSGKVIAHCCLTTDLVGGVPADRDGVRAFCCHHLKIAEGPELEAAINRIMSEEVGERDATPDGGEVKERESYGVNVLRKDEHGHWLGDWQIKAAIKQAASRVGVFTSRRGAKGDMSELGRVWASGASKLTEERKIYLVDADGKPAQIGYERFLGRVQTPSGPKSIVSDAEVVRAGTHFEFMFSWYDGKATEEDIIRTFAALPVVGVGSARSLERGKFEILTLTIDMPSA